MTVYRFSLHTQLDHPSIVHFHDSFLEGDSFFIATEFCEVGPAMQHATDNGSTGQRFCSESVCEIRFVS